MIGERSRTENGTMSLLLGLVLSEGVAVSMCGWMRALATWELRGALPRNGLEHPPQPLAAYPVDVLHPDDPAIQMGAEVGMAGAVLSLGSVLAAIVQGGLERIVVGARDIEMFIDDETSHALAAAAGHDACLARVEGVAFAAG